MRAKTPFEMMIINACQECLEVDQPLEFVRRAILKHRGTSVDEVTNVFVYISLAEVLAMFSGSAEIYRFLRDLFENKEETTRLTAMDLMIRRIANIET